MEQQALYVALAQLPVVERTQLLELPAAVPRRVASDAVGAIPPPAPWIISATAMDRPPPRGRRR